MIVVRPHNTSFTPGIILVVIGLLLCFVVPVFFGVLLIGAGILGLIGPSGFIIDPVSGMCKRYRELGFAKTGTWLPIDKTKPVVITIVIEKEVERGRYGGRARRIRFHEKFFVVSLSLQDGSTIEAGRFGEHVEAFRLAEEITARLQMPLDDQAIEVLDDIIERRAKRDPRSIRRFRFRK
jgi:hypothetical protein